MHFKLKETICLILLVAFSFRLPLSAEEELSFALPLNIKLEGPDEGFRYDFLLTALSADAPMPGPEQQFYCSFSSPGKHELPTICFREMGTYEYKLRQVGNAHTSLKSGIEEYHIKIYLLHSSSGKKILMVARSLTDDTKVSELSFTNYNMTTSEESTTVPSDEELPGMTETKLPHISRSERKGQPQISRDKTSGTALASLPSTSESLAKIPDRWQREETMQPYNGLRQWLDSLQDCRGIELKLCPCPWALESDTLCRSIDFYYWLFIWESLDKGNYLNLSFLRWAISHKVNLEFGYRLFTLFSPNFRLNSPNCICIHKYLMYTYIYNRLSPAFGTISLHQANIFYLSLWTGDLFCCLLRDKF